MDHLVIPQFLGLLVVILGAAKLFGTLARRIGQPAVLGELVAGVLLGTSISGLVDPKNEILHLFSEIGVVILLFETGLETDLRKLLRVGGAAMTVAVVGGPDSIPAFFMYSPIASAAAKWMPMVLRLSPFSAMRIVASSPSM